MKEGWEIKKLGEICTINPPKKEAISKVTSDDMVSFLPMEDLDIKAYYTEPKQHRLFSDVQSSYTYFTNGDVLLAKVTPCFENGKIGIAHNLINGIGFGSSEFLVFRLKEAILKEFLYYYLQNKTFVKEAIKNLTGSSGLRRVPKIFVENSKIPVPSIAEQEKIVAELDCLSGIIEKKKQQLKEYDALAQSIFYEMFGEDEGKNNGWTTCQVGDVYKFQYGKGNKIPENKGEYPCYGSNGQVGFHVEYNAEDSPIIGHIGAYAGIVIWASGKHYVTYNGVICNLINKDFDPIYAYHMLKSQNYMEKARGGAAQPFVSYDVLREPIIYVPPLTLQQEFASKIEAIEKQKELIKKSIEEVETLFNSRMDLYFN